MSTFNGNLVGAGDREVLQHGTVGDFIGSTLEGSQSGFVRCVYTAKHQPNNTVTLLCEKAAGCCLDRCCPEDQFWMTGVFILLGFVLIVFVVGACAMIICYQRSKVQQRREEKDVYEYFQKEMQHYQNGSIPPGTLPRIGDPYGSQRY